MSATDVKHGELFIDWRRMRLERRRGMWLLLTVLLALSLFHAGARESYAQTAYTAVWRPGSGAQWWWSGLCLEYFKTEDKVYFSHNLRLVDLEIDSNPRAIYRLPFDPGPGWKLTNGNWDDPIPGHGGDQRAYRPTRLISSTTPTTTGRGKAVKMSAQPGTVPYTR